MSQYSEIIGSFIRNGNFPLEADYVFETEQELLDFYELPENKALLHPGLLKIVKSDENKKQALYWVVLDEDLEPTLTKLISVDNIQDIIDLEDKINKEIEDREKAITALWGTTDPSTIDSNLDSIKDLSEELKSTNQRVESIENIKDELKATVGTTSNDIIAYLQTLPYKSLTDLTNQLNSFLTSKNDQEGNITTFPELQDFLNGYTNKDTLSQVLSSLISQIQGTPAPTETFQTLTSAEQFVRELKQKLEDSIANLQEELNNTQEGVGLDGSGSYDADQQTTYLKGATSVMSALRTLDQVISTALDKGSVYAAKGSVKDLAALKAVDKVVAGDVYNVEEEITLNNIIYPAHNNFVYIGEQEDFADVETNWDSLGGMIEGGIDSITLSNNKLVVAIKGQSNIEVPLIGETTGLAYDGAKGKANRDALNALPEIVITSIDAPTYSTSEATLHIKKAQKSSENNQYGESTGATTTIAAATASTAGLMSSEDKTKLNSIESGANNYSLPTATSSILGGVKSTTTGTAAGKDYNVQVNSDGTMKVNVPWTDTTYTEATTSTAGLMSTADKTKLNNLPTGETITADLGEITEKIGTNEYADANYISKETNLTDAAKQLDEEIKATNDNLAILNAATIKGVQVNGVDITPKTGKVNIANASTTNDGAMSKEDKAKVDGALQTANAGVGILASYTTAAQKAAITPTDTINQAIGKLEKALNDLSQGESKPVADQIEEAITALIGGASEGYQTLKELEDAIKANKTSIQELQSTKPTGWIAGVLTPTSNDTQYKLYFNRSTVNSSTISTKTQTFNLDSATQSKAGVMSAADKVKVDKIITNGDGNSYLANNGQYKPISDSGNPIYKHISTTLVPAAGSSKKCLFFPINASKKSFDFYIRCQRQRVKEFVSNIHVVMGCSPTMGLHTYSTPQIICDSDILQGAYYVENPGNHSNRYLAIQADYFGVLNDTAIIDLYSCVDFIDDTDNTLSLLTESTIGFTVTLEEIEDVILKNNGYTKIAKVASDQNLLNTNGGYTAVSAIGEALNLNQYLTSIPKASASTLGGVKVGAGLSITGDGVLSATGGGTADSVEWDNVVGKPSVFTTNIANISDLNSSWDSILTAAPKAQVTRWPSWSEIESKPAQFTPASHTHTVSQITDLTSTLGNYATNTSVQQAISEATYNTGHNTATSLTSVPITKRLVIATLSAGGTLSLAGTPADGKELHIIVKSTSGGAITLPTSGSWIVMGEKSLTLEAGGYCEINIISDGSNLYARMG